ncbi:hypothetical protein [Kitasatospora indigofera]|uniref:hypothetical protein n=1 Tax=Kitasatospora indigofera TaxID=67307 RepID=UPI0033A86D45
MAPVRLDTCRARAASYDLFGAAGAASVPGPLAWADSAVLVPERCPADLAPPHRAQEHKAPAGKRV